MLGQRRRRIAVIDVEIKGTTTGTHSDRSRN